MILIVVLCDASFSCAGALVTHNLTFGVCKGGGPKLFTVAFPLLSPPMHIPFGQLCAKDGVGIAAGDSVVAGFFLVLAGD